MPLLGWSCPVISFMNVDLPAPLGPSRPVMPGGTFTVTSFRPITCPYHFDTCSALTTAGRPASPPPPHDRCGHAAHATTSTPRTRRSRIESDTTTSPSSTMNDTSTGVS